MRIGLIAFTDRGLELGRRLARGLEEQGDLCSLDRGGKEGVSLAGWTDAHFLHSQGLIYIGAAGIAVRAVAPWVKSKTADPAVLCCDENGRYVIPLLSGHIGGANDLARRVAALCGGQAVITTATDGRGLFAADSWAKKRGLAIVNPGAIKTLSARLLAGRPAPLHSDFPIRGRLPQGLVFAAERGESLLLITDRAGEQAAGQETLVLAPPTLWVGIGCRRGVPAERIEAAFLEAFAQAGLLPQSAAGVASVDRKAQEPGLLAFCAARGLTPRFYSPEELAQVEGSRSSSEFVQKTLGVDYVCERAALAQGGRLVLGKQAREGVTVAVARRPYFVDFEGETT